jgi:hypothetical protein
MSQPESGKIPRILIVFGIFPVTALFFQNKRENGSEWETGKKSLQIILKYHSFCGKS